MPVCFRSAPVRVMEVAPRLPEADDDLPACEHRHLRIPPSGLFSAAVGALFGLPSLRIKGFYLAVATLAAQFFLEWCFIRVPWLFNYSVSGAIECRCASSPACRLPGPPPASLTRYRSC